MDDAIAVFWGEGLVLMGANAAWWKAAGNRMRYGRPIGDYWVGQPWTTLQATMRAVIANGLPWTGIVNGHELTLRRVMLAGEPCVVSRSVVRPLPVDPRLVPALRAE